MMLSTCAIICNQHASNTPCELQFTGLMAVYNERLRNPLLWIVSFAWLSKPLSIIMSFYLHYKYTPRKGTLSLHSTELFCFSIVLFSKIQPVSTTRWTQSKKYSWMFSGKNLVHLFCWYLPPFSLADSQTNVLVIEVKTKESWILV